MGEPPLTSIKSQVDAIFEVIHPHLDKGFAFWGHSMGAIMAFELARQLAMKNGLEPVHLFVSGRQAPQAPNKHPNIYNLPEPELLEELKRLNGTPKQVLETRELVQLMLPILRADFEAIETYVYSPGPGLNCPITVFGGTEDNEIERTDLDGWREHTTGSCSVRIVAGDHFFLHTAQPLIFRIIEKELQQNNRSL
jgi:medium-chain acyl-[acyl-carrier-protein] hydrolase